MDNEKINCFMQKNKKYFSSKKMIEMQHLLKDVPDEAFFILMNHKPHGRYYYTKQNNKLFDFKYRIYSCLFCFFLYAFVVSVFVTVMCCIDENIYSMKFWGLCVLSLLLLFATIVFARLEKKHTPKLKSYGEYVFEEFCDLLQQYKHN